mgnify:CR=1 FL=1
MIVIYYSPRCQNSVRLLGAVRRIPSLQGARLVNVDTSPVSGITHVPTLVDEHGNSHIGGGAFTFIKRFDDEIEIEAMQLGGGGLTYGTIEPDDDGTTTSYMQFGPVG